MCRSPQADSAMASDPRVYWTFVIPALGLIICICIIVFIIVRRQKKRDIRQKNLEQYYPAKTMEINIRSTDPTPEASPTIKSKGSEENV